MKELITEKDIRTKFLQVPFKHAGRSMDGCDCWGIVKLIYKDLYNIDLIDFEGSTEYDTNWYAKGDDIIIQNYYKQWEIIQNKDVLPYDMVFFKNNHGVTNHIGLVLSKRRFIHCSKAGTIVSKLSDEKWDSRIENYYRFRGIKND